MARAHYRNNKAGVKRANQNQGIVVQEINVIAPDRSRKDIASFKNALQSAESVHVPNRVRLYDLYEDITLDGHLTGIIDKRLAAVLNKDLYFEDAAGKRVDEMDKVIKSRCFKDVIKMILEQPLWGLSGMEFIPGEKLHFDEIPRKHIKPHLGIISYEQNGQTGIPYEGVSNLWILGKNKDLGKLLKCAPYAIWKRGDMADWAQYIEIFGQPVRVIYYDAYDTKTRMELRKVLDESGSSLAMMIPKQAQFEMKDGKQSNGTGELQERFKIACDNEMSVIILGNTETTQSSKSSGYAQSKEHGEQQLEISKNDLDFVADYLNEEHFIKILKSYGYPVDGGRFVYEKEIDINYLKGRIEVDKEVSKLAPISHDYYYETYGIPKPDNYNELVAKQGEEREAMRQSLSKDKDPEKETDPQKQPKKEDKKSTQKPLKASLPDDFWTKARLMLSDFFRPGPLRVEHNIRGLAGLNLADLTQSLEDLHKACNCEGEHKHLPDLVTFVEPYTSDEFENLVKNVFKGKGIIDGLIDPDITRIFATQLWDGVTAGYGKDLVGIDYETPDALMLEALQKNVWNFSAAKNYTQVRELGAALLDAEGKLRSWPMFRVVAGLVNTKYAMNYMRPEYDLAVTGAQMAAKWQEIEQSQNVIPLLQYDSVIDNQTTDLCRSLDGTILPATHKFWDTYYPPNHYNERATVRRVGSGNITPDEAIPGADIPDLFKTNLGKNKLIFPADHPYFVDVPEAVLTEAEKLRLKANSKE